MIVTKYTILERKEGISLYNYARDRMDEREQQRQQEKREAHNKQEDTAYYDNPCFNFPG